MKKREVILDKIQAEQADLLVIGGGITGAGIALDAQSRGMRTVLIDMQDFASGTSSRSTKLIHGGLRYLKQLQFGVVAQTGRERAIVYANAPHITRPEWMMLPLYKGGTYGKWASSAGILAYDYLAGVRRSERRQMLSRAETLKREPLLKQDGLKGSGYYVEYRTDDARLTIEVVKKAAERGAFVLNYVKATDFIYDEEDVKGVHAYDILSKKAFPIKAKKIVNATGPWVDELREKDHSKKGKYLYWTKGVHIVTSREKFPLKQSVYFDVSDGRMIFAIPREDKVYIGTTDTTYTGDLQHPQVTEEDIVYLLEAIRPIFPTIKLSRADVESCWAGVRPLIHEEGKSPSEISRKDEVFHSPSGLITIAGGKLTGYRKMAERVVDRVAQELKKEGRTYPPCSTQQIALSGGDIHDWQIFVEKNVARGRSFGLSEEIAKKLTNRYGSNVDEVYAFLQEGQEREGKHGLALDVYAVLRYGMEREMVMTPVDFFSRRTGALFFDVDWVKEWRGPVISYMREAYGWSEEVTKEHRRELEAEIARVDMRNPS